jgi:hypothetical protein
MDRNAEQAVVTIDDEPDADDEPPAPLDATPFMISLTDE